MTVSVDDLQKTRLFAVTDSIRLHRSNCSLITILSQLWRWTLPPSSSLKRSKATLPPCRLDSMSSGILEPIALVEEDGPATSDALALARPQAVTQVATGIGCVSVLRKFVITSFFVEEQGLRILTSTISGNMVTAETSTRLETLKTYTCTRISGGVIVTYSIADMVFGLFEHYLDERVMLVARPVIEPNRSFDCVVSVILSHSPPR